MSPPTPTNPLQRAHALSLQASTVLRPSLVPLSTLNQALSQYREAIELYEKAQQDAEANGSDEVTTLKMLVIQHRKLLKDVERRIAIAQRDHTRTTGLDSIGGNRPVQRRLVSESAAPIRSIDRAGIHNARGFDLASIHSSDIANRMSPPQSIPPFALRPSPSSSPNPNPPHPVLPIVEPSLSPLYSSSSTSSSTEESYIHFGASPNDNSDPFSRFWNMLENMIEEVSGPVMFATAPVDLSNEPVQKEDEKVKKDKSIPKKDKDKDKGKGKEEKPEESFYMIKKSRNQLVGKGREIESTDEEEELLQRPSSSVGGPTKTAEELSLENESLKTSLNSLALHAESVDNINKNLKIQLEEREKGFKVLMESLKKEAGRVKAVGQEVWKSQLLSNSLVGSSNSRIPLLASMSGTGGPANAVLPGGTEKGCSKDDSASRKRIKELEDELRLLKSENEKQKETIVRYKERFEKIKSNAKAKKEAKIAAAAQSEQNNPDE